MATKTKLFSLLIFLLFTTAFLAAILSKRQVLWMDEILSYLLISDPSLAHLNDAIVSGLDANPPLFANIYWLIAHAVSLNVTFLKSISIILFSSALAALYYYTSRLLHRSIINFFVITLLAAFTFLNSTLATQIRAYSLFLLITLGYFISIHKLSQRPSTTKLLIAHTGLGLLTVLTHNFGLFYVAAAGAFISLLWLWSGNKQYSYALGTFILIGIGWLLIWYPSFAVQAKAGEPHSWIPLPTFQSFFSIVGELAPTLSARLEATGVFRSIAVLRFLGLVILFGYIAIPRLRKGAGYVLSDPAFLFYFFSGFVYLATIVISLTVSLLHTSVFISRYLWPSHFLVMYQLVYAVQYAINRWVVGRRNQLQITDLRFSPSHKLLDNGLIWVVPFYLVGLAGLLYYQSRKETLAPTTVMACVNELDKRYPVFLESSINFIPVWFYSHQQRPVYFLLDRESAFAPANDPGATVGYHTLAALKAKYNVDDVKTLSGFKPGSIPHFFVVDEQWNYQIERFIQNKTVRVIRTIPTTMNGITIRECAFTTAS